ncbi:MAG: 50S ribosomal protein L3 [candidate division Zixibacteria bacterium]|nr:50S ribosomal protein L3 [candidate division Zixibacteria bacterium]
MRQLFGYKKGMTRLFLDDGTALAVTAIEVKPCTVVQVKTSKTDGYDAVQLGFGEKRKNLVKKPQLGHFGDLEPTRFLREVRLNEPSELKQGDQLTVEIFKPGERVDASGLSKGLGFQGGVRRHKFGGGSKTHGQSDRWRAPGSVGQSSYPSRVFKGLRMAGRMGNEKVTVRNLRIVGVRPEDNLLFVEGAVPGKNNTVISIRESNKR